MKFNKTHEEWLLYALRIALGIIFIWFGFQKFLGFNSVYQLMTNSITPFIAAGIGLKLFGILEILIGIFILFHVLPTLTYIILTLHLLGTFTPFLFGTELMFDPYFPILSLNGEFVLKNIVLILTGLLILARTHTKDSKEV